MRNSSYLKESTDSNNKSLLYHFRSDLRLSKRDIPLPFIPWIRPPALSWRLKPLMNIFKERKVTEGSLLQQKIHWFWNKQIQINGLKSPFSQSLELPFKNQGEDQNTAWSIWKHSGYWNISFRATTHWCARCTLLRGIQWKEVGTEPVLLWLSHMCWS